MKSNLLEFTRIYSNADVRKLQVESWGNGIGAVDTGGVEAGAERESAMAECIMGGGPGAARDWLT
jgi:hypothetical protein